VLGMIERAPKRVLDVGCSDGSLGVEIKKKYSSAEVHGIEFDPEFVKIAQSRLATVTQADLNHFELVGLPEGIDLIIFADVLEHTVRPQEVLEKISSYCGNSSTEIIVSVPNVQHITVLGNLISGSWPERDRGIFDTTHLRWFTLEGIKKMGYFAICVGGLIFQHATRALYVVR